MSRLAYYLGQSSSSQPLAFPTLPTDNKTTMRHLLICREYPPAPGGGIGTYAFHMARLLAEHGETVHVIGQLWAGASKDVQETYNGRLLIHRVPFQAPTSFLTPKPNRALESREARDLFTSTFAPQCFSWQASLLAEKLIQHEGIDVIEAQDYEAPLYYLQLRRALGFGPRRRPPCIVHLHSPTEFIARYNDWDLNCPHVLTAKRLEDYSITAADALLCPSHYLARQAQQHYDRAGNDIYVIPYPLGSIPIVPRDAKTWRHGTISYAGRLERRKGVLEWLDAAIAVAPDYPTVRFEFLGANILDANRIIGEEWLERRIPPDLRPRFLFRGEQRRDALPKFLQHARMAVVPSRWENFPNTCIEAMCTGLPVIASRQGGMIEMIEDGRTGWLADRPDAVGLARALKRALGTPSTQLAAMGREAASRIRQMCDNQKILERHLHFRNRLLNQGTQRSCSLSGHLSWNHRVLATGTRRRTTVQYRNQGIALVVMCGDGVPALEVCIQRIVRQKQKPVVVVLVYKGSPPTRFSALLESVWQQACAIIPYPDGSLASALITGIEAIRGSGTLPLGIAFLEPHDWLEPGFITSCEGVLRRCAEIGVVSCWSRHARGTRITPCPEFPYQWIWNDAAPCSVIRTEAIHELDALPTRISPGAEQWHLCNAVMSNGWLAVTLPETLVERQDRLDTLPFGLSTPTRPSEPHPASGGGHCNSWQHLRMARRLLRYPRATFRVMRTVTHKLRQCTPVSLGNFLS